MKVIVGLGNVGAEYEATRHNVGFLVVQQLAANAHVALRHRLTHGRELIARYGDWSGRDEVVRLLLPQTMMNASGAALAHLSEWQVKPSEVLVVCDDVNLPLGTLRLRALGSDGGHHGLASCLERLQTRALPRLRVGIGVTSLPKELTEFVLSPFHADEDATMRHTLTRAVEVCQVWAEEGMKGAMTCLSRRWP